VNGSKGGEVDGDGDDNWDGDDHAGDDHADGNESLEARRKLEHPRFYTPRECARLMGFPETYSIDESNYRCFHQLGNAVVPPVIEKLARAIVDTGVFVNDVVA
jgi:site-specific DNA-cytosine methylase